MRLCSSEARARSSAQHRKLFDAVSASQRKPEQAARPNSLAAHDSLPRYANVSTLGLLRAADYIGTISFAHSGAMLAAAAGMDLLGTALVGTITAVGGGTIRDAVILAKRPFWTEEVEYLYLCLLTAATTFVLYSRNPPDQQREESALEFASDTVGVAAFCVIGAINGVRARVPALVTTLCGTATATFGGVVRDLLVGREVRILHSRAEIYATTAGAGAAMYVVTRAAGGGVLARVAAGTATAAALRTWAWLHGVRLPVWPSTQRAHDDATRLE
ncbi:hypothetical protein BWQ96_02193 [Gracilariopsis chorda]|uniref:Glycine transporter domain-containing protein n=1 Tax=Gracilariopsis chorda TaxID=448386 RepID=A0A2V3J0R0_9FLOR|nr:hypothetical protein BWQ96_02193 [Gracilariopsis chorda]|eukprot:PXF48002.1 hypothetical protein BWQ96_02193 [Gracilariopsis chorda]